MREAYSHEVSSAGFWPGGNGTDFPAFYSYTYPMPAGFKEFAVQPEAAYFSERFGSSCSLTMPSAPRPIRRVLLAFLQSTYEAAAITGTGIAPRSNVHRASSACPAPSR